MRAATRLKIAQPAISRQIKSLEEDLGVDLFTRNPKGVTLTNSGTIFLTEAKKIIDGLEMLVLKTQKGAAPAADQCILGACNDPMTLKAVSKCLRHFTSSETRLITRTKEDARRMVLEGSIDFFIDLAGQASYEQFLTFGIHSEVAMVARPADDAASSELPHVVVPSVFTSHGALLNEELGTSSKKPLIAEDWASALALVSAGRGRSLIPASWACLDFENVQLEPSKKDLLFHYQIFFSSMNESASFAELLRWLQKN